MAAIDHCQAFSRVSVAAMGRSYKESWGVHLVTAAPSWYRLSVRQRTRPVDPHKNSKEL